MSRSIARVALLISALVAPFAVGCSAPLGGDGEGAERTEEADHLQTTAQALCSDPHTASSVEGLPRSTTSPSRTGRRLAGPTEARAPITSSPRSMALCSAPSDSRSSILAGDRSSERVTVTREGKAWIVRGERDVVRLVR
jgi:hypothetical protein